MRANTCREKSISDIGKGTPMNVAISLSVIQGELTIYFQEYVEVMSYFKIEPIELIEGLAER